MYCPKCGNDSPENAAVCQSCSQPFNAPPPIPTDKPKTSKLAIWALILSILVFFTCGLTTLPAIICGIIALVKISKNKGQLRGTGLAITGIALPFVGSLLLAVLMPALGNVRCVAHRMVCGTNLSNIGKSMILYTNNNDGQYPDANNWCYTLIDQFGITPEALRCPSSDAGDGTSSYVLNINTVGKTIHQLPPDMVLVFETNMSGKNLVGGKELLSTENHRGEGCNVSFVDGSCKFVKDPNGLKWMAE